MPRLVVVCILVFMLCFMSPIASAVDPITNLSSIPDLDHILFDWDDAANIDYWNISELEESAPYVNTSIILDGLKDSVYDNDSHGFIVSTPNHISPSDYETIYWFRNDTHLIGYADGFDADSLPNDDSFTLGVDNTGNGLTADDREFILSESGSVAAKRWSGSSWLPQSTSSEGVVLGAGGAGAISYEMIIPLSEMSGFVNGVTARFFMQRADSSQNPDVVAYYPETLINDTDATIWANATLTATENYVFVGNTTTSDYNSSGLTSFTWYKHRVTAINGTNESSGVYSTDVTLDLPKYTVSGYIIDYATGLGIAGATVYAANGIVIEADISNATGYYIGHHFHNGTYRIFANAAGYETNNTTYFTVNGANITNKNITLVAAPLSRMPYQIYMMLISIVILLVYFTFTVSDPEYYTDIITSLFAMLISAIVAHNSIMGVLVLYPLQTEVQYDIITSSPLGIVFAMVSLLMLLIFVTKILDLTHRETDSI